MKEKIESVLEKLDAREMPAEYAAWQDWILKRINEKLCLFKDGKELPPGDEWLLIGEITEALREKEFKDIHGSLAEDHFVLEVSKWEDGVRTTHYYDQMPELDAYLQAAEELLREEAV